MVYLTMKQFDLAGAHFDRALALNPNDTIASMLRGLWLAYMGRGEEALRYLDADLRRDPFPPSWYWEFRGVALFQMRRYRDAIASFEQVSMTPWWDRCYLAACHAHLGIADAARSHAAEVLRQKPDFSIADVERCQPWRDAVDSERLKEGLRNVGLPG
jgi:adenylate cyclase